MKFRRLALGSLEILSFEDSVQKLFQRDWEDLLSLSELACANAYTHHGRRQEFIAGRILLHQLEPSIGEILRDPNGMPRWPHGFIGSVSHKNGYVIAAMGSALDFIGIGIDLELKAGASLRIQEVVCRDQEITWLESVAAKKSEMLTLIFSAKEALFKCCYPSSQIWFGFHDAQVLEVDEENLKFRIQLLKDLPPYFQKDKIFEGDYMHIHWDTQEFIATLIKEISMQ